MKSFVLFLLSVLTLSGCVADQRDRRLAQPMEKMQAPYANGAIFKAGFTERPLFEERRARNVGDMLVMNVPESALPKKKMPVPKAKAATGEDGEAAPENSGKRMRSEDGDEISFIPSDALVGNINMTVMRILENGHLLVSGGKQVQDYDDFDRYVRITGVVDPYLIKEGNTIQSAQMTDVKIRVDEVRIHSDGTAINFSEGQNTFGNFFHSMKP